MGGYQLEFDSQRETYVRVTEDNMSAWLYLANKEEEYTKEEIIALLEEQGITYGLILTNIIAMVKKRVYGREIKVAEGTPQIEGIPGCYEFMFDTEGKNNRPTINEDGSVDYSSMSVVQQVEKGAVIAIYHPAVQGESGHDVYDKESTVTVLKELPPLKGKGFMMSPEDMYVYLANANGKVEYKDGRIEIKEIYTIEGDVSLITERVEFFGDVMINGSVEAGVTIRAGKTLTINGVVEAVQIYAGGDVILKHGIQGGGKAKILARGNVFADFIEHTIVETKGDVRANIIMNSQVYADGDVKVTGKKGSIIGGYVHALKGIEASEIGNSVEVRTMIHAGCLPELIKKWQDLGRKENEIKKQISDSSKELNNLLTIKKARAIPKMAEEKLNQLAKVRKELEESLVKLEEEKEPLMELIKLGKDATIRAGDHIYRGSIVEIDSHRQVIEKSTCYMEYANVSGVLTGTVIVKN